MDYSEIKQVARRAAETGQRLAHVEEEQLPFKTTDLLSSALVRNLVTELAKDFRLRSKGHPRSIIRTVTVHGLRPASVSVSWQELKLW